MLFISHNLAVVRYLADTIAVMYCGKLVEVAPAAELVDHAQHPYTRTLLASVPTLRGENTVPPPEAAGGGRALDGTALDAEPADPHHPPAGCRFHPRCPVGPVAHPEREACRQDDPSDGTAGRPHRVACFFPVS